MAKNLEISYLLDFYGEMLLHLEQQLGLARRFQELQEGLEQIILDAKEIAFQAEDNPNLHSIETRARQIVTIADRLCE